MKKKTWMKCIASCLTFVLLVTMVPVQAAANTEKEGGTGTPGQLAEVLLRLRRRLQLQQQNCDADCNNKCDAGCNSHSESDII